MFNNKYVDLNQIRSKIMRNKLFKNLSYEATVDYAVECLRLLNSEKAEVTIPYFTKVEDYRAELPAMFERVWTVMKTDENFGCRERMSHATGYHNDIRHCVGSPDLFCDSPHSYSMNNNYIHTSFEEGYILMAYKGLKVNEEGIIMIPDNVNVTLAVSFYIKWRYLDDMGSDEPLINRERSFNDQQYCWYIGKAQGAMSDMSDDEYESFTNAMSSFIPNNNHFSNITNELGMKNALRNQR